MKKETEDLNVRTSKFRIALLAVMLLLIAIRLADMFLYPETQILPPDFFFAVVIVQLFFLWYDDVKEKYRIIWVQKKKEELNEMKSKFAAITSHELATPVAVIKGYIGLMMDKILGELTEPQIKALDIMNRYFTRLEEIQTSLRRLYSNESADAIKNFKPASIEEIIKATAEDITPFVNKRNQNLIVEVKGDIPELTIQKNAIRQVLVNLLLNAIRFTPDKGRIIVRADNDRDNVRVVVEDNGIGIPREKLNSIFESFYEAQDTNMHSSGSIEFKSGGMGLGLAIAKNIIDTHKGRIWAESEENKFSRFIFTLPNSRHCEEARHRRADEAT